MGKKNLIHSSTLYQPRASIRNKKYECPSTQYVLNRDNTQLYEQYLQLTFLAQFDVTPDECKAISDYNRKNNTAIDSAFRFKFVWKYRYCARHYIGPPSKSSWSDGWVLTESRCDNWNKMGVGCRRTSRFSWTRSLQELLTEWGVDRGGRSLHPSEPR